MLDCPRSQPNTLTACAPLWRARLNGSLLPDPSRYTHSSRMVPFGQRHQNTCNCWLLLASRPRTSTSLSLPYLLPKVHRQTHGCETTLRSALFCLVPSWPPSREHHLTPGSLASLVVDQTKSDPWGSRSFLLFTDKSDRHSQIKLICEPIETGTWSCTVVEIA